MSVVRIERIKLTAAYLNAVAGGLFTAAVVAPVAAAVFGIAGPAGQSSSSALEVGVLIRLTGRLATHGGVRYGLEGPGP